MKKMFFFSVESEAVSRLRSWTGRVEPGVNLQNFFFKTQDKLKRLSLPFLFTLP
jgi:hypothetical protein